MKRDTIKLLAAVVFFAALINSNATSINLYVDSAPNAYGSPNYASWWANAQATAASGAFVNMANSVNPLNSGTTQFEIEDAVVYSFGDLGRRLHFVYWVPEETIASLTAKNFQISLEYQWDGVTYDGYFDYYGQTWLTPGSWIEYNGGVIGTAGWAYWGAYNVNTPEALDQDLADWDPLVGDITLRTRVNNEPVVSLTVTHGVPEGGATAVLFGAALVGLATFRRRVT